MNRPYQAVNVLLELARNAGLVLRLILDGRVPAHLKLIPVVVIGYIISPIDLMPDIFLGLGQLDDLAILLLGIKLFIDLSPREVVEELRGRRWYSNPPADEKREQFIDASYKVVDDDSKR